MNASNIRQSLYQCLEQNIEWKNIENPIFLLETDSNETDSSDNSHAVEIYLTIKSSNVKDILVLKMVNGVYLSISDARLTSSTSKKKVYTLSSVKKQIDTSHYSYKYFLSVSNSEFSGVVNIGIKKELKYGKFRDLLTREDTIANATGDSITLSINEEKIAIDNGKYVEAEDNTYVQHLYGKDSNLNSENPTNGSATIQGFATISHITNISAENIMATSILPKTQESTIGNKNKVFKSIYSQNIFGELTGDVIGNASSATQWQTSRNFQISDHDSSHSGEATSVNGTTGVTLKLPSTIKASLEGNASSATQWETSRNFQISDHDSSHSGEATSVNGTTGVTLKLPSTIKASLNGNADSSTKFSEAATISLSGAISGSATGTHGWSITTSLSDNSVGSNHLQSNSVGYSELIGESVRNDILANESVSTAKIVNSAVTNAKLANSSITIGSTEISLGSSTETLSGLSSVSSKELAIGGNIITNGNITISHAASADMSATSVNPKITFSENGSQPIHLIYTDYDDYRSPAGLKIIGGDAESSPAWFEVEGAIYTNKGFKGNADSSTQWQTSRNFQISDHDSSHSGEATSVNGTTDVTLKLPSTIKASLDGNALTSSNFNSQRTISIGDTLTNGSDIQQLSSISNSGNHELKKIVINDKAVTTIKINDLAVTTDKINNSAVTTTKINDLAVTNAKLAGSILNDKLVNSSITIGSTEISLGSSTNTLSGLSSVSSEKFIATSDQRLKKNIIDYTCKKSILDLPIKEYDYKDTNSHAIGCIAQDLQEICPEIVHECEDGYLRIEESKIIYPLIQEVKQLKSQVNQLTSDIEFLKQEIKNLKK